MIEQKMRKALRSVWLKTRWYKQRVELIFLTCPYALLKLLQVVSPHCEINKKAPYKYSWALDQIHFKTGRKAGRFKKSKALFSLFVDSLATPERALRFCSEKNWWTYAPMWFNKQNKRLPLTQVYKLAAFSFNVLHYNWKRSPVTTVLF